MELRFFEVEVCAMERRGTIQNCSTLKRTYKKLLETEAGKGKTKGTKGIPTTGH